MRRPTKQTVLEGMRSEARRNQGRSRLIEAVELDSGILVVEYRYEMKFPDKEGKYHYQRRICIKPWWDRTPLCTTVETGIYKEN